MQDVGSVYSVHNTSQNTTKSLNPLNQHISKFVALSVIDNYTTLLALVLLAATIKSFHCNLRIYYCEELHEILIICTVVFRQSVGRLCSAFFMVCGCTLLLGCVVAIGGLVWIHIDLKHELDSLKSQMKSGETQMCVLY